MVLINNIIILNILFFASLFYPDNKIVLKKLPLLSFIDNLFNIIFIFIKKVFLLFFTIWTWVLKQAIEKLH